MGKKEDSSGKVPLLGMQPVAPKKAMSAFFLYRQDVLEQVKKENPDAKMTEITKLIA
jgi:hypothetical protein